jgi:peptide/nickel transport system substrate-binding protein
VLEMTINNPSSVFLRVLCGFINLNLLAGTLFLVLGGCAGNGNNDHDIRFGVSTEPATLDPRYVTDAVSTRIARLLYRRLVAFDDHYRFVPSLAHWVRLAPGHYRFTLRADRAAFSNGEPVTASDVKATYSSVLMPGSASPQRDSLAMIDRMQVVDDDTIDFYLTRPDPLFPGRLVVGILPRDLIRAGHDFGRHPVGSGPLRLVAWSDDGDLVLERRRDGQRIRFLTVRDPTVRVLKLLSGELDLIQGELPQELVAWLRQKPSVRVQTVPGDTFAYIGFNLRDPATGDARVRAAVAHAINRRAIIEYLYRGTARLAESLLPPEHWAGADHLKADAYDPSLSRHLLKQAGYTAARPLILTFKVSTNPRSLRLAAVIQQQLARVGIDLRISSYDWGTFFGDIKAGRFQMYSLSWVGLKMPDVFRYVFHSASVPPAGANRGRLSDPEVDRLIEKAENTTAPDAKAAVYFRLQQRLHELRPYVPLWYEANVLVIRRGLEGYAPATDGNYDDLTGIRFAKP